jgi:acyl-CoA synthetase (AMP-forming)/AMP-acid ligase II
VSAAVVPADGGLDVESLDAHCRSLLAPAKLPRNVQVLAELPRTNSGKVAKQRLAQQTMARGADASR